MDYKIYSNRTDGEFSGDKGGGADIRGEADTEEKNRICNYISLKTRRNLKLAMDIAELEMLWSAAYIAMVIGSTADLRQQIAERITQIRNGIIFLVIGMAVWLIAYKSERYLKNRKEINDGKREPKRSPQEGGHDTATDGR